MNPDLLLPLCGAVLLVSFLYSSVGHAGASGYIAVMTLFGFAPSFIRPVALLLNILVATIATWQFYRAGHFSWKLFWPFAALSVPFAFLGGYLSLPTHVFKIVIGIVLLYSAFQFIVRPGKDADSHEPGKPISLCVGAGLGFLSGLTGVGGGIFLTPLLIFLRWSRTKTASSISALFILVNSISGILGNVASTKQLPLVALPLAIAAIGGGFVGSYFGSRKFSPEIIKTLLGMVLTIAGYKLIFT